MSNLSISHVDPDDESLLVHKTIKVTKDISIDTPFKLLDFNDSPGIRKLSNLNLRHIDKNPLIEKSTLVNPSAYEMAINDPDVGYLQDSYEYFKGISSLKDKLILNTLTFKFNPYSLDKCADKIRSFLNIYYGRTDLLFIPNIKVLQYENKKKTWIMGKSEYVSYIDEAYDNLSFRNKKPIFAPISLRYGVLSFKEMVTDFLDKGYRYFWLDFEGSGSMRYAAQIRGFHEVVERAGLIDEAILYATNVRRELNPHIPDASCGASDVLSSPLGVDFIGVNRAPLGGGGKSTYTKEQLVAHKARFFDRTDYNYTKYNVFNRKTELYKSYNLNDDLIYKHPRFSSNYANSFEINSELSHHRHLMYSDESIMMYLREKRAISPNYFKKFEKIVTGKIRSENTTLNDFF